MQCQRHVPDGVGKIEPNDNAACLCCRSDSLDIEQLTREKVHAGEHHHRELIGVLLDQIDECLAFGLQTRLCAAREDKCIVMDRAHDARFAF